MVSLWTSKKKAEDGEDGDSGGNSSAAVQQQHGRGSQYREPDERTRLLPPQNEHYLSPDDPAVTPYNLWSIRAVRYLSVLFLFITFLWWVLLLVSIFIRWALSFPCGHCFER